MAPVTSQAQVAPRSDAIKRLAELFHRNGYARFPNPKRREATPRKYKKGYEVRLTAGTRDELRDIRRLLRAAGFNPARPFSKDNQWRQPIYGRQDVARFLDLVGWSPDA